MKWNGAQGHSISTKYSEAISLRTITLSMWRAAEVDVGRKDENSDNIIIITRESSVRVGGKAPFSFTSYRFQVEVSCPYFAWSKNPHWEEIRTAFDKRTALKILVILCIRHIHSYWYRTSYKLIPMPCCAATHGLTSRLYTSTVILNTFHWEWLLRMDLHIPEKTGSTASRCCHSLHIESFTQLGLLGAASGRAVSSNLCIADKPTK